MTVYAFSRIPAYNPNTNPASVAKSATGSVYDIGDTGFLTPLNLTLVATNTVTTTLISDANGMFPDFTLVDRTQCAFKSGTQVFVLTTTTPVPGPTGPASTVPGPPGPATTDASLLTAGTIADGRLPSRLLDAQLSATYLPKWKATTAYLAGDAVLNPSGDTVTAIANFTSGASYNAANWNLSASYERGAATVIFVAAAGSNSNDGRTWNKAKATIGGALAALAGGAGVIEVGAGTITETVAWGTIPGNTVIQGRSKRATTILKGYSGDLATLADGAEIHDLTIDGQGATYTGYGFLMTGTDGNQVFTGVTLKNFDGPCLDFAIAAGSGFKATNLEAYRVSAGTGTGRYAINISDTQQLAAVPRSFVALTTAGQCAINFGGCNDTLVSNSFIADVRFTPDSRGVNIATTRIANQAALTVDGHNNSIVVCDINPAITIASGADAITIGPGSFNNLPVVDNSGNARNNITHWAIAYTPTLTSGGTAPSLGNGTLTGSWSRSGAQVTINIEMVVGSTTTLGTGGLRFSLPKARVSGTITSVGTGIVTGGATNYTCAVRIPGAVGYCEMIRDTTGSVTYNSPATFATGDTFRFTGTYMI